MANTTTTVTVTWGNSRSVLYAGTPLDAYGNIANNSSAYGILQSDLHLPDRTATVITAGEWDEEISRQNGIVISDECKAALSGITFTNKEKSFVSEIDLGKALKGYVKTTDTATKSAAGVVKMAEAVADSEEQSSPTTAEFNSLLAALRTAGTLETPAEPEEPETTEPEPQEP